MTCFEGIAVNPVLWLVVAISAIAAFVLLWVLKFQTFDGKVDYGLTFAAMIWTLVMVGVEAASASFSCQLQWATFAWLGNALLPVAWCYFVFSYVDNASWVKKRSIRSALIIVPLTIFVFAATNQWHGLVYTDASIIPQGQSSIEYDHGPGFYGIVATLYVFVFATLTCLVRAFKRAKRAAWPLLTVLILITLTPLFANAGYVIFGLTVFGLDPTAFMFTFGILAFTWILVKNKTMDMAFVGPSGLVNTMSEPVIMVDRDRRVFLVNSPAKRSDFQEASEQFLNEILANIETLSTGDSGAHIKIGSRIYEPRIREIESPLDPASSILGWSITFIDITDRIAISAALEEALERADEANRAKDEFISVVSHELRTPLTSLIGGLTLARSGRLGDVADPVSSVLDIAHRNGIRLSRLVDNILLAQKININALTLESKHVDIAQLLEDSFKENKMFASEQGVGFVFKNVSDTPIIAGDAFAIRQIIDNLISNAIKFSDKNGIVEGALETSNGQVKLSIANAGQGIPAGMERQVFGRFEQVENSNQRATQGSGLGLHISKNLANLMTGDIFYESDVGKVTTFYVVFPLVDVADKPERLVN